jgi:hypothetical protein
VNERENWLQGWNMLENGKKTKIFWGLQPVVTHLSLGPLGLGVVLEMVILFTVDFADNRIQFQGLK